MRIVMPLNRRIKDSWTKLKFDHLKNRIGSRKLEGQPDKFNIIGKLY